MSPLRVAMPMLTYVPGGMGGTEVYARELIRRLVSRPEIEVTTFVSRLGSGHLGNAYGEVVATQIPGGAATASRLLTMARSAFSSRAARGLRKADVIHYPFTVPVPVPRGATYAVSLHDVQHLDLPQNFSVAERNLRRLTYNLAARHADLVFTVSEFSKQRIEERLGVASERIVVAPLGVSPAFRPGVEARQNFVLYPARRWPHKNHARLVEAMAIVRKNHPRLRLVLTGGGSGLDGAPDWVEQRGAVPEPELAELYRTAGCVAFPSLYEGFGMPPLEAMASGCPVAIANAGALPETCGDAAVRFDPHSPDDMAQAIVAAIEGANELVPRGIARAAAFTWDRCAAHHMRGYCALKERSRP